MKDSRAPSTPARPPNGPPSLLLVTTVPATINAFLAPFVEHFTRRGWRVDVATGDGPIADRVRELADAVHRVGWSRRPGEVVGIARSARRMRRLLMDGDFDIVHVHTPIAAGVTRAAAASIARSHRPAVVYTAHGFHFTPDTPRLRRVPPQVFEWVAGRATDQLIVINEADRNAAERLRLARRGCIARLPGIGLDLGWYRDTPQLRLAAATVRAGLGLPEDAPLLTFVGELVGRKGPQHAIDAVAALDRRQVHLALAGTGPDQAALETQIATLGLTGRVHFLGQVADIRPLVLASALVTLPSYREGLSRAVLEALALGVPVVGSDIRGIADSVLPDGGIVVPIGDVGALTTAYRSVLDNPGRSPEASEALRERVATYSVDAVLRAHEAIYAGAIDRRMPKPSSHRPRHAMSPAGVPSSGAVR